MTIERRSFLAAAIAASPAALVAQSTEAKASPKALRVARGEDRLGERHNIGLSTTVFKVLTKDSVGALFVMEHQSNEKGGPPRRLHHNEDEWFYVVEGEYIAEIALTVPLWMISTGVCRYVVAQMQFRPLVPNLLEILRTLWQTLFRQSAPTMPSL